MFGKIYIKISLSLQRDYVTNLGYLNVPFFT